MDQKISAAQIRAGAFDTVSQADMAIRRLLAAGFPQEYLAVICPSKFKEHFQTETANSETPSAGAGEVIATGGAIGATLGGLALAATVLTGGLGAVAAAVFIGGGAIAGGFSNLIVSKGYETEENDYAKQAIQRGQIVVGVEVPVQGGAARLAEAQRILEEAGAKALNPL